MTLVERLRKCLPYDQPVGGPLDRLMHEAAHRIEALEVEDEFNWRAAYRKEHADLCAVEARAYVLEAALREIATRAYETGHELQVIARKALGEE